MRMTALLSTAALSTLTLALWAQAPPAQPAAPAQPADQSAQQAPATPDLPQGKTRFQGTIANTGGTIFLGGFFTLEIDHWSTPDEIKEAQAVFVQGGGQALLEKVWKSKQIGFLQVQNSMGKAIYFARAIPVPGGMVVRALTNNSIGRGYGRAGDYPFGYIELIIPNDGKGTGVIVGMAKIALDANGQVQIEGYGTIPEKLMDVAIEKKKK